MNMNVTVLLFLKLRVQTQKRKKPALPQNVEKKNSWFDYKSDSFCSHVDKKRRVQPKLLVY